MKVKDELPASWGMKNTPVHKKQGGLELTLKVKDELQKKRNQNEPRNAKEKFGILLKCSVKFFSLF